METPKMMADTDSGKSSDDVCPICHGLGWELYTPDPIELPPDYIPNEYARKCPRCFGIDKKNDRTKVPDSFYEADIYKFDFKAYKEDFSGREKICRSFFNDFPKWQAAGKGLYLYSKIPGSGKTFLACCLGKSVMMKYGISFRFVTAPDYLSAVGESYEMERGSLDPTIEFKQADLLVIDDIGSQHDGKSGWERTELFKLINNRMNEGKITIYTSNMEIGKLNLDDRIKSRIFSTSIEIDMPEESIRDKMQSERADAFLNKILGE